MAAVTAPRPPTGSLRERLLSYEAAAAGGGSTPKRGGGFDDLPVRRTSTVSGLRAQFDPNLRRSSSAAPPDGATPSAGSGASTPVAGGSRFRVNGTSSPVPAPPGARSVPMPGFLPPPPVASAPARWRLPGAEDAGSPAAKASASARPPLLRRAATTALIGNGKPKRTLANILERNVLKSGIRRLHRQLVVDPGANIEFPPATRSAPSKMSKMSESFLTRLLRGEVEVKGCMEGDISMSQPDLKHLRMEQLLAIRSGSLDFETDSDRHSAHQSFLQICDQHMFEKFARHVLSAAIPADDDASGDGAGESPASRATPSGIPERPDPLRIVGVRAAMIAGALEAVANGLITQRTNGLPELPDFWIFALDASSWGPYEFCIFNTRRLQLTLLQGPQFDFAAASAGAPVAVVADRTGGQGRERMLHWDVAILDPREDDVLAELRQPDCNAASQQMAGELAARLAQRRATASAVSASSPAVPERKLRPLPPRPAGAAGALQPSEASASSPASAADEAAAAEAATSAAPATVPAGAAEAPAAKANGGLESALLECPSSYWASFHARHHAKDRVAAATPESGAAQAAQAAVGVAGAPRQAPVQPYASCPEPFWKSVYARFQAEPRE